MTRTIARETSQFLRVRHKGGVVCRVNAGQPVRALYGLSGAIDVDFLLEQNKALFAGGELSQEEKNAYFEAVMTAYITCKEAAKIKFGPKDK